jgi:hypothetical protein
MVGILVHGDNHFIVRGRLPRVCKAGLMVVISSVPPTLHFVCPSNAPPMLRLSLQCFEVKPNLAISGSRWSLDSFPRAYCYRASTWEISQSTEVIVLERHH